MTFDSPMYFDGKPIRSLALSISDCSFVFTAYPSLPHDLNDPRFARQRYWWILDACERTWLVKFPSATDHVKVIDDCYFLPVILKVADNERQVWIKAMTYQSGSEIAIFELKEGENSVEPRPFSRIKIIDEKLLGAARRQARTPRFDGGYFNQIIQHGDGR